MWNRLFHYLNISTSSIMCALCCHTSTLFSNKGARLAVGSWTVMQTLTERRAAVSDGSRVLEFRVSSTEYTEIMKKDGQCVHMRGGGGEGEGEGGGAFIPHIIIKLGLILAVINITSVWESLSPV